MTRTSPHLKQEVRSAILAHIYFPAHQRLEKRVEEIITKNTAMIGSGDLVISYKGENYSCIGARRTERKINRLLPVLRPYMDEWLNDKELLVDENQIVSNYLATVLNASNNVSDYFRLLPDCVHPALQPYAQQPNVQPPLSDEQVQAIQAKNQKAMSMIRKVRPIC